MRTNPPAETTLLRDERKQLDEETLSDELEEFGDDEDEEAEEDDVLRVAWGFGDSRRGVPAGSSDDEY